MSATPTDPACVMHLSVMLYLSVTVFRSHKVRCYNYQNLADCVPCACVKTSSAVNQHYVCVCDTASSITHMCTCVLVSRYARCARRVSFLLSGLFNATFPTVGTSCGSTHYKPGA